ATGLRDLDLHLTLLELAVAQQLAQFLARALVALAGELLVLRHAAFARRDEYALPVLAARRCGAAAGTGHAATGRRAAAARHPSCAAATTLARRPRQVRRRRQQ